MQRLDKQEEKSYTDESRTEKCYPGPDLVEKKYPGERHILCIPVLAFGGQERSFGNNVVHCSDLIEPRQQRLFTRRERV